MSLDNWKVENSEQCLCGTVLKCHLLAKMIDLGVRERKLAKAP